MLWSAFSSGGFYQALSPSIAADTAVNVYTETRAGEGTSPKSVTLYGTPGLSGQATAGSEGCRGWFTQDGETWTVIGPTLYAVDTQTGVLTSLGTIADDGLPVFFASNGLGGDQLGICGGGQVKVLDLVTGVLGAAVALPFSNPIGFGFMDGYGLIVERDTPKFWFSALEDFETWDALDFTTRSETSDNFVGIGVSRTRIWAFGSETMTQFYNSGDVDTPFLPYPGTTVQTGLVSAYLLGLYDDIFVWVGESRTGQRRIFRATDANPQEISTPPVVRVLAASGDLSTAELLIYEQEGHPFYAFTFPNLDEDIQTYCFDGRENQWHARAGWNSQTGTYTRWRAKGSTSADGRVWVGDYATGDIAVLDLGVYTDYDDQVLRRERAAPYLGAEAEWVFVEQVELGTQPGMGLSSGQGSAPVVNLEISRDGSRTWVNAGTATLGPMGNYTARAIWRRLGRARLDRLVLRITQTDQVKCVWGPGLWLRVSPGTGQL